MPVPAVHLVRPQEHAAETHFPNTAARLRHRVVDSNGEIIPAPSRRSGFSWQNSWSQSLYARAMAAASRGSMSGMARAKRPERDRSPRHRCPRCPSPRPEPSRSSPVPGTAASAPGSSHGHARGGAGCDRRPRRRAPTASVAGQAQVPGVLGEPLRGAVPERGIDVPLPQVGRLDDVDVTVEDLEVSVRHGHLLRSVGSRRLRGQRKAGMMCFMHRRPHEQHELHGRASFPDYGVTAGGSSTGHPMVRAHSTMRPEGAIVCTVHWQVKAHHVTCQEHGCSLGGAGKSGFCQPRQGGAVMARLAWVLRSSRPSSADARGAPPRCRIQGMNHLEPRSDHPKRAAAVIEAGVSAAGRHHAAWRLGGEPRLAGGDQAGARGPARAPRITSALWPPETSMPSGGGQLDHVPVRIVKGGVVLAAVRDQRGVGAPADLSLIGSPRPG